LRCLPHLQVKKKGQLLVTLFGHSNFGELQSSGEEDGTIPRVSALTKIMEASMKIINDALPNQFINFLTQYWPMMAAPNATATK
jgi:hypothetical protein